MTVNTITGVNVNQQPRITMGQRIDGAVEGFKAGCIKGNDEYEKSGGIAYASAITFLAMGGAIGLFADCISNPNPNGLLAVEGMMAGMLLNPILYIAGQAISTAADGILHPSKYLK